MYNKFLLFSFNIFCKLLISDTYIAIIIGFIFAVFGFENKIIFIYFYECT